MEGCYCIVLVQQVTLSVLHLANLEFCMLKGSLGS
jgi:hypothetical protein